MLAPGPFADAALAVVAASGQVARRLSASPPRHPREAADALVRSGLAAGCLPEAAGGVGLATEPGHVLMLLEALRSVARADLCTGRLFEAHAQAVRLLYAHAPVAVQARAAARIGAGCVLALWDEACDARPGAGAIAAALVPVETPSGPHLGWLERPDAIRLAAPAPDALFPLPAMPAPRWTRLAVQLGAIEALAEAIRQHLRRRPGAGTAPLAEAVEAAEAARLWVQQSALLAEDADSEPGSVQAHLALARRAVARATAEATAAAGRADAGETAGRIARALACDDTGPVAPGAQDQAGRMLLGLDRPVGEAWM